MDPIPAASADHELVVRVTDPEAGLRAIVALHDTTLGPAIGGCRMRPYPSEREALRDALRLSRAMSFKTALAGLPLGGGKSVILGDPERDKTPELLESFGRAVEALGGRYRVAEDVGIGVRDVEAMARVTRWTVGGEQGAARGNDPAPWTAYGVLTGIRVAVRHALGRPLAYLRVGVSGTGSVGTALCYLLRAAGVDLVVADVDGGRAARAARDFGARVVDPEAILREPLDVLAPCAIGGVLDARTVPLLGARVVAGAANDQLATPEDGDRLWRRGVVFAPDFVINAGGVIHGAHLLLGEPDREVVRERIRAIGPRLESVLRRSETEGRPPHRIAEEWATAALAAARARRPSAPRTLRSG